MSSKESRLGIDQSTLNQVKHQTPNIEVLKGWTSYEPKNSIPLLADLMIPRGRRSFSSRLMDPEQLMDMSNYISGFSDLGGLATISIDRNWRHVKELKFSNVFPLTPHLALIDLAVGLKPDDWEWSVNETRTRLPIFSDTFLRNYMRKEEYQGYQDAIFLYLEWLAATGRKIQNYHHRSVPYRVKYEWETPSIFTGKLLYGSAVDVRSVSVSRIMVVLNQYLSNDHIGRFLGRQTLNDSHDYVSRVTEIVKKISRKPWEDDHSEQQVSIGGESIDWGEMTIDQLIFYLVNAMIDEYFAYYVNGIGQSVVGLVGTINQVINDDIEPDKQLAAIFGDRLGELITALSAVNVQDMIKRTIPPEAQGAMAKLWLESIASINNHSDVYWT